MGILLASLTHPADAQEGQLTLEILGDQLRFHAGGDGDEDYRLQSSEDFEGWSALPGLGTLLGAASPEPLWTSPRPAQSKMFYRAVPTEGLFDPTVFRTLSLTFSQADWRTRLANGHNSGVNTIGNLSLDNGGSYFGVGARYKGNTSYSRSGTKKSLNLEIDATNSAARMMRFKTVNLNNAFGDNTILHEPLFFGLMNRYTVCPRGSVARVFINGADWGVYSFVEQENNELIQRYFPSDRGDRWKAPNAAAGGGGPGGGGAFSGSRSALSYLGPSITSYQGNYELKTDNSTNAWERLVHATDVLNNTPAAQLRDKVEDVLAVDRWLWFLAIENIFADDDSYFNKGADYGLYYEPESGRIHPVEHDGNEAFTAADVNLTPVQGATATNRPVLYKLLPIPDLRQRYLAHMRTVLEERFNPGWLTAEIDALSQLSRPAIQQDPVKGFTMPQYDQALVALKTYVTNRHRFLTNHAELRPIAPGISDVRVASALPSPTETATITARVTPYQLEGVESVWLNFRGASYGRFASVRMVDDGAHGDGLSGDGVYGAVTAPFPAGTRVRYYVEARSGNAARAARFSPAQAEEQTYSYRVRIPAALSTPVVINEIMSDNARTLSDPQGEFDDWIELHNVTDVAVDLTGRYLSDEPNNPRKWAFPAGTQIPAKGYLVVWADEDGTAPSGLHASFKLASSGESVYLTDRDANQNAILDAVTFGFLPTDVSYGRSSADPSQFITQTPSPLQPNP